MENAAGCQLQASFAPLLSALGRACRHPDKNEEGKRGECEMRMKEINAAYRKLEQVCASPHVLPSPALSLPDRVPPTCLQTFVPVLHVVVLMGARTEEDSWELTVESIMGSDEVRVGCL